MTGGELRSVIQGKPIYSTQPWIWHLWGGKTLACTKTARFRAAVTDSEVNTSPQMVCSLSEYQRQQGSLHIEQEELLFQLCCSSLDMDERMSLFILFSHHSFPSDFIQFLFSLESVKQSGSHMELQGTKSTNEVNVWQILQVLVTWCGG